MKMVSAVLIMTDLITTVKNDCYAKKFLPLLRQLLKETYLYYFIF